MKRSATKAIFSVILVLITMLFAVSTTAHAKTVQDSIEEYINGALNDYESAETDDERDSVQDQLDSFLEENGLGNLDLGSLDLGSVDLDSIVSGLMGEDGGALGEIGGLISDAFNSGLGMIMDVIGGGLGTSDGSNTATTEPAVTSPNVIIADGTTSESGTQAVGVPNISTKPSTPATTTEPSTSEVTTYNVGSNISGSIIGSGVTTTQPADTNSVVKDDGSSSVLTLIVLSASALIIIISIVVFFYMKRRY